MNENIIKYPRTPHLEGSRLQPGDEDLSQIPFKNIKGKYLVVEEKIDGANCAISFDDEGNLLLQSRGHYLTGGYRERHYNLFKQWASIHREEFFNVIENRYIIYGEWMYAKHKVYYDNLPSYFMEFDVYDKTEKMFLSTEKRQQLLKGLPICSVPVLSAGVFNKIDDILKCLVESKYKTPNHLNNLIENITSLGLNVEETLKETDTSNLMEGLYIKVEENGTVVDRIKYVRYSFTQTDTGNSTNWINKPIIPNKVNVPFL
jgi:hypothetical protein